MGIKNLKFESGLIVASGAEQIICSKESVKEFVLKDLPIY